MSSVGYGFYKSASVVRSSSPIMFSKSLVHNLNLNRRSNRRSYRTCLSRNEAFRGFIDPQTSRFNLRRTRDREGNPPPIRNTELHLRSTYIVPRKTVPVTRTCLPRRPCHLAQKRPEEYYMFTDPSQSQADLRRRARMIPESRSMRDPVLNQLVSRMFGVSTGTEKTTFAPAKINPFQSSNTTSSPNTQVVRRLSKMSHILKRPFSTMNRDRTESTDGCLSPPALHGIPKKTANKTILVRKAKKVLPRGSHRSDTHLRRHAISRTFVQPPKLPINQLLRGPFLLPASKVSLRNEFRVEVKPEPNLCDEKITETNPPIESASNDLNSVPKSAERSTERTQKPSYSKLFATILGALDNLLTRNTTDDTTSQTSTSPKGANSSKMVGRTAHIASKKIVDKTLDHSDHWRELSDHPSRIETVYHINHRLTGRAERFNKQLTSSNRLIRASGVLPRLPSSENVLTDVVPLGEQPSIARLSHGLDRVLFNQSVHWLQDPHSGVFNFPPNLQTLPSVTDFAFERLSEYKHSSEDDRMLDLAVRHSKPFIGSTSSLTKILSHIYFLLSEDKLIDISTLSVAYADQSRKFTPAMRAPALFTIRRRSLPNVPTNMRHVCAVENPRSELQERHTEWSVLLWLGTMMEKFLTLPAEQFDGLLRSNPASHSSQKKVETYRYAKSHKFIMRSQLDCQDSRLPGTGVFDLKSRAVLPIRIDQLNIHARIGNMDGIFVAYHNTARLFGFQYVPVVEMEERLYGPGNSNRGPHIFQKCVGLMEAIMERIVNCFPDHSLSCTMDTREDSNQLIVWVVPIDYNDYPIPIEKFAVTVEHVVNKIPVNGRIAIERAHQNWTVLYTITRSLQSREEIWASLKRCQQAGEFTTVLPEGVSADDARAQLNSINWGSGSGFKWDPEDRVSVRSPDEELTVQEPVGVQELQGLKLTAKSGGLINKLRTIARRGTTHLKHERTAAKKPQILWGRDPDIINSNTSSQLDLPENSKSNFSSTENPITDQTDSAESTFTTPSQRKMQL